MKQMFKIFSVVCLVLALMAPSAAFAQGSGSTGYGDDSSIILPSIEDGGDGDDSGSLPFTGAELSVLAGAGAVLVLMGFALRRVTNTTSRV